MAKLTGKKKAEFLKRMAKGRKKAANKTRSSKRRSASNPLTGTPSKDIPKLMREGKSQQQAIAIAMEEQRRRARKKNRSKTGSNSKSMRKRWIHDFAIRRCGARYERRRGVSK